MALARSLSDNYVGPEGAKALGEALKTNKALTSLKCATPHPFRYCQQPLTTALSHVGSLFRNDLGPTGAAALGEALKTNSTLENLK